jgi:hypothetical protein
LAVALSFCRLLGLGCPKQAFAKIATPRSTYNGKPTLSKKLINDEILINIIFNQYSSGQIFLKIKDRGHALGVGSSIIDTYIDKIMRFKAFHFAQATIAGIETAHMIRKGQLSEDNIPAYKQFMALAG